MLDIAFKQNEDDLFELKAQFSKDVDPDALLASISSLLEMVRMKLPVDTRVESSSHKNRKRKQRNAVGQGGDIDSVIANMPEASKTLLVSLLEYEKRHGKPVEEIWDIREYAKKFKAYIALMDGKNREQEVTALRYQLRLLRDRELLQTPPDRSLTALGAEIAERLQPLLDLIDGHNASESVGREVVTGGTGVQEPTKESDTRPPDGRLSFEHS